MTYGIETESAESPGCASQSAAYRDHSCCAVQDGSPSGSMHCLRARYGSDAGLPLCDATLWWHLEQV